MEPGGARVLTQLRRGVLEYCVLALLRERPHYGFDLVRRLGEADGLLTSEGTIYPLLSRLRKDGLVTTTWQESDSGPPRRYYDLTDAGRSALAAFADDWRTFSASVNRLLDPLPPGDLSRSTP
jgi:PadR family transcriptional regulator PadR